MNPGGLRRRVACGMVRAVAAMFALLGAGCGGGGGDTVSDERSPAPAAASAPVPQADATRLAVAIEFTARMGSTPVQCGQTISGLGSTLQSGKLKDFRFYVSEVRLIRADGAEVPVQLPANDAWNYTNAQGQGVTLIDLEDGTAECGQAAGGEGDSPMNATVGGTVPAGRYVGVVMTLGVPESVNHTDTAQAPPPLDIYAMGWGWQAGRKFAKIEVTEPSLGAWPVPAQPWPPFPSETFFIHLGSTGCTGNALQGTVSCARPNRASVRFAAFDPATQRIAVDLQPLLLGTNVTINQGGAQGCMSAATDADCLHVFESLGIDWRADGSGSGQVLGDGSTQTAFRVVAR